MWLTPNIEPPPHPGYLAGVMSIFLAATEHKLTDAVALMIVGMAVVFGSLTILLAVITLINRLLRESPKPAAASASTTEPTELVAVLTAAATAALGRSVRVTDVQPASGPGQLPRSDTGRSPDAPTPDA